MKRWLCWLPLWLLCTTPALALQTVCVDVPQLAVTGRSLLKYPADQVTFQLGVMTEGESSQKAIEKNSELMEQVLSALRQGGLKKGEYETGRFSLNPQYAERPQPLPKGWKPYVRGYELVNELTIRTQQLEKVGDWIDLAVQQGANQIGQISFSLHKPQKWRSEAIRAAAGQAKQEAQQLAAALGVELMEVLQASLDQAEQRPFVAKRGYAMMANSSFERSVPPIEPGEIEVSAEVTVVYQIGRSSLLME